MKRNALLLFACLYCLLSISHFASGQGSPYPNTGQAKFTRKPFAPDFVANHGQFNVFTEQRSVPGFGGRMGNTILLFHPAALEFVQIVNPVENEKTESEREEAPRFVYQKQRLIFLEANEDAEFIAGNEQSHYYSYLDKIKSTRTIKANCFGDLTVKNLYDGIDVTYSFAVEGGLKYAFIIHPGADPKQIRMKWEGTKNVVVDAAGNLIMDSENGTITDRAPVAFYAEDKNTKVSCSYSLKRNNISLDLGAYDMTQALIIDPWVINPNFVTFNSGYDIQHDNAGNIYVYGGANPYELQKYDSTGSLIWTFNTFAGGYYGDFTIDPNGYLYIIYGPWTNQCLKLDPSAGMVWNSVNPNGSGGVETYRIKLNPITGQMIIVGMHLFNGLTPMTETLDTATGAYSSFVYHPTCINGEIRSLAIDDNGDVFSLVFSGGSAMLGDNLIWKQDANLTTTGSVVNGYLLYETEPSSTDSWYSGYNGMAVGSRALYTYDGEVVKKWDKSTLALIGSVIIAGGVHYGTAGLCVDSCDNVFVGGPNSILMFDSTMTQVASVATPGEVYDVNFGNKPGEILACGFNFVGAYNFPVCFLNPVAIFTAPNHICPGTCTDFINLSSNGQTFQWLFPGATPSVSTDFSPTNICYNSPGNYSVTLIVSNANGSDTLSLNNFITVYPYPPPQGILQSGDTLFANAGAVSYQWYFSGNLIPGATNDYYVATTSGNYNVVATDLNGCEVEAAIFDVIASLAHAPGLGLLPFVSPNPAFESLTVHFPNQAIPGDKFNIYNSLGERVLEGNVRTIRVSPGLKYKSAELNISGLSQGIYYLEISYRSQAGTGELFRSEFVKQ